MVKACTEPRTCTGCICIETLKLTTHVPRFALAFDARREVLTLCATLIRTGQHFAGIHGNLYTCSAAFNILICRASAVIGHVGRSPRKLLSQRRDRQSLTDANAVGRTELVLVGAEDLHVIRGCPVEPHRYRSQAVARLDGVGFG